MSLKCLLNALALWNALEVNVDVKYRSRRFILALLWTIGTLALGVAVVFKVGADPLLGIGVTAGLVMGGYGFTRETGNKPSDKEK